jgi:hypothetical protein
LAHNFNLLPNLFTIINQQLTQAMSFSKSSNNSYAYDSALTEPLIVVQDDDVIVQPHVIPEETAQPDSVVAVTIDEKDDPNSRLHKELHKKDVLVGIVSGVAVGGILLGPIGAVAGGFGGRYIVKRRERRYRRRFEAEHSAASTSLAFSETGHAA